MRERAHRGQHVARLERARRAGRPRADREPARVERRQERLALDVEARERQRRGGDGPPGRPTTSTSGTSAATRVRSRSTSRRRAASSCGPRRDRHLQRDRGRQRRGHADAAGEPPVLVLGPVGGAPDPGPRHEDAEPARAAPVARVRREQVPGVADVDVTEARARVHEQRDAGGARGGVHGIDGLQRADLAVRVLEGGERHARAARARSTNSCASTRPSRSTPTVARSPAKSAAFSTAARSTALTTTCDPVRRRPRATDRTAPCSAAVCDGARSTSWRPGADGRGDRLARAVEQHPRPTALGVQPPRVRPALVERLEERGARLRQQRRAAAGVEDDPPGSGVRHRRPPPGCRRGRGRAGCSPGHRNPAEPSPGAGPPGSAPSRRSGPVKDARCDGADTVSSTGVVSTKGSGRRARLHRSRTKVPHGALLHRRGVDGTRVRGPPLHPDTPRRTRRPAAVAGRSAWRRRRRTQRLFRRGAARLAPRQLRRRDHRPDRPHHQPVGRLVDRRAHRRRHHLGPDPVVRRGLPEAQG